MPSLQIINLNNNPLGDVYGVVDILAGISTLRSIFMSLTVEEEVDYVLKKLPNLEYLNGLAIDREEIEGASRNFEEDNNQNSSQEEIDASAHKQDSEERAHDDGGTHEEQK